MKQEISFKLYKWIFLGVLFLVLVFIYKNFSPYEYSFFPKCPFKWLTGYLCPGCGTQRALHYLLNFEIYNAIKENALVVLAIPYLIIGYIFKFADYSKPEVIKWHKRLFGVKAILSILILVITFTFYRNIYI